jgi:hypothetical protein
MASQLSPWAKLHVKVLTRQQMLKAGQIENYVNFGGYRKKLLTNQLLVNGYCATIKKQARLLVSVALREVENVC